MMTIQQQIIAFSRLGDFIQEYLSCFVKDEMPQNDPLMQFFHEAVNKAVVHNAWFTKSNMRLALEGIQNILLQKELENWTAEYPIQQKPKAATVAVVMAGNIPAVGFHDFLCVLMSGNAFLGKLSSDDAYLLPALWQVLLQLEPAMAGRASFTSGKLESFDAVIATGSNNTARYFDYYFGKYPHIIRQNRNGVAIIEGNETKEDFSALGLDVFSFFGLGCRNVSSLFVPENYNFEALLSGFAAFENVAYHNKYHNNYMYNKSLFLINRDVHFDNGFVLLVQREQLASPVAVVHYQFYQNTQHLDALIQQQQHQIQCIVSHQGQYQGSVRFGEAQKPGVSTYADGIDTMAFLCSLR